MASKSEKMGNVPRLSMQKQVWHDFTIMPGGIFDRDQKGFYVSYGVPTQKRVHLRKEGKSVEIPALVVYRCYEDTPIVRKAYTSAACGGKVPFGERRTIIHAAGVYASAWGLLWHETEVGTTTDLGHSIINMRNVYKDRKKA